MPDDTERPAWNSIRAGSGPSGDAHDEQDEQDDDEEPDEPDPGSGDGKRHDLSLVPDPPGMGGVEPLPVQSVGKADGAVHVSDGMRDASMPRRLPRALRELDGPS
jgi:hypothetical protein